MSQTTNELRADVVKLLCDLQEQWLANASGMPSSRRIKTVDDSVPGQQARGPDDYDNEGFALRRCASDLGRLITQIEKAARHEQAQGGMAWIDRPTEPGWYWHATDEGMEPVEVMVRPGHSYLATLEIGSFGKREFHPVMRQRGQWLRIDTPTRPTADARQETQG